MSSETPYQRLIRMIVVNDEADEKIPINVHYTSFAGSKIEIIEQIEEAIKNGHPFGLKCDHSTVVYIPHQLKCYYIGGVQLSYAFKNEQKFIEAVKMQYMTHKEFVSMADLLQFVKSLNA